jgi:hypothetical protein
MAQVTSSSSDSPTCVEWMWKSNGDPCTKSEPAEWRCYSDVENNIIEEAFKAKKPHAMLDDYHIDFKNNVQIANNDVNKQMPIKRMACKRDDKHLREEHFMINPFNPERPFNNQYGWVSLFIVEVKKDLRLKYHQMPSQDEKMVPMIVEKAALGIIEEGKKIGEQCKAELMARKLMERKEMGMKEVWKCCAHIYSMSSFLYGKLNETMRLIGSEEHEHIWRSKIRTFGPFCLLLWSNPFEKKPTERGKILYRGAQLSDDLIVAFKDKPRNPTAHGSFQAFTSASRNRNVAEFYGNVLLIMRMNCAYTVDLNPLSDFQDEEEELIHPGVCFTVERVESDEANNKHVIYLNLTHRYAGESNEGTYGDEALRFRSFLRGSIGHVE